MNNQKLKKSYKQTDVGFIPDDWEVERLGEKAEIVRGGSPRPAGDPKYFNGNFIPWLTVASLTNIPESQNFVSETIGSLTEEGSKHSRTLERGTLIISNSGATLGVTKILDVKCCANDGIAAFLNISKDIDILFLCYYLNTRTKFFREVVATGNGQPNLNTDLIGNVSVPLPPLPEQQAIAEVLSGVDALITSLDELIAKKQNIKQGTMSLLLTGKKRLPGFSGDWEMKTFEELADKNAPWSIAGGPFGSNLKASDYTNKGVRVIQLQNIGDGSFQNESKIFTTKQKADELLSCNIFPGEIIISKMGDPVARACIIPNTEDRYLMCSDGIRLVVDKTRFDVRFVHAYINSKYFRQRAIEASTGSTRVRIGLDDLKRLPFIAPIIEEQKAIAQILSEMDAEIEALEAKREKYQVIKQGMMQELLTGKTRLI